MILTMPSEIEVAAEAWLCGCVTLSQEELNLAISLGSCGSGRRLVNRRSEMDIGGHGWNREHLQLHPSIC